MHYICNTEQEAINLEAALSKKIGYPIVSKNSKTGKLMPEAQQTLCWAIPFQRKDGKWIFPELSENRKQEITKIEVANIISKNPCTIEKIQSDWFEFNESIN